MEEKLIVLLKLCMEAREKGHNVMFLYGVYVSVIHFVDSDIVAIYDMVGKHKESEYNHAVDYLKGLVK